MASETAKGVMVAGLVVAAIVGAAAPLAATVVVVGDGAAIGAQEVDDAAGSRAKVTEEMAELDEAIASGDANAIEDEMGDVLFALVNLSRHVKVDAEGALRRTIDKFTKRFAHVESRVKAVHGGWGAGGEKNLPLEVLDTYWEEAKADGRKANEKG